MAPTYILAAMSCDNPVDSTEGKMPRRRRFDKSKTCAKCKVALGRLVIRHTAYCKECFFPLVTLKFRRCVDPTIDPAALSSLKVPTLRTSSQKIKASGDLLLGYSGGVSSSVLLDLVSQCYFPIEERVKGGKGHPRKGQMWSKVRVCYVETCAAVPGAIDMVDSIESAVSSKYLGFIFVPVRLEDAFDPNWWQHMTGREFNSMTINLGNEDLNIALTTATQSPVDALRNYLASLPTPTAVTQTIRILTRMLLMNTARATRSSHLLLGTNLTSLSISLISTVAHGGGFTVREERGEEWGSVRVVTPLRDVGMKECAAWLWWAHLRTVTKIPQESKEQTIGKLTQDFIVGLERDYPSTVSTIARTIAKLVPKGQVDGICLLCNRPIQQGSKDWKPSISIRRLSEEDIEKHEPSLASHLCYSCNTTLTSRNSKGSKVGVRSALLPVWVSDTLEVVSDEGVPKKMGKVEMKQSISSWLIDDA